MMERATLESFLAPISRQLGHEAVPQDVQPLDYEKNPPGAPSPMASTIRSSSICLSTRRQKVQVSVHRCKSAEVAQAIVDIIEADDEAGSVVYADDHRIEKMHIPDALEKCDAVTDLTRWDATAGRDAHGRCMQCRTLRYHVCPGRHRRDRDHCSAVQREMRPFHSLLPTVHIAIVNAADVKATMGDWLAVLDEEGAPAGENLSSQICFISGPSATADIELVRVEGVHGPMAVHYIVIEGRRPC